MILSNPNPGRRPLPDEPPDDDVLDVIFGTRALYLLGRSGERPHNWNDVRRQLVPIDGELITLETLTGGDLRGFARYLQDDMSRAIEGITRLVARLDEEGVATLGELLDEQA